MACHSRKYDDEVQFYAFDILVDNGEDLRRLPLHLRKNNLARPRRLTPADPPRVKVVSCVSRATPSRARIA
jgi:ATP-dependent DNA ligase